MSWHVMCAAMCCSEAYGLQEFYQHTQEQLQARRDALQSGSQPDQPVTEGDVTSMAVKFERSVSRRAMMRSVVCSFVCPCDDVN